METKIRDFEGISLKLASPDRILSWSHGEVTKPETINYRTIRAERDGLFDERIFGPAKDWECYCGKYRRIRYKGIVCDKCGVEVTRAIVRRERMGHIKLSAPVSHIWFLRGVPSKIGIILDMSVSDLEKVIYFAGYIVTDVDTKAQAEALEEIEREFKVKSKKADKAELSRLKEAKDRAKEELRSLKPLAVVSEVEYHRLSLKYGNAFSAEIGSEAVRKILESVDMRQLEKRLTDELEAATPIGKKKILKRLKVIRGMISAGIKPEWMFLTVIPVIPPDLRPMVQLDGGRFASSDLNDLYRRVINRNNRLKRLFELKAPEVITRNEKRMLQEAVDALIDNSIRRGSQPVASQVQRRPLRSLADMLKGKQGRFRQNLLGKRVDYSGRSVIVVGPTLKLHQCGLPKKMALELFKPFVIRRLLELEIAHNIKGAGKLIEERPPEVWAILEEVIQNKYVLLNRAPTLHRLGIQAFQPILIEGDAIQIHPLVCRAFNADFDGDQMAVHVPLSDEAQAEARDIMLSTRNLLKPATGAPIVHHDKDMVLGCFWATLTEVAAKGEGKAFSSDDEAVLAFHFGDIALGAKIKVLMPVTKIYGSSVDKKAHPKEEEIFETSVGRILFNRVLPDGYEFVNQEMTSKNLEGVVSLIIKRDGIDKSPDILDRIKQFGFEYATKSGISWGMDDLRVPEEKTELIKASANEVDTIDGQYQAGLLTDHERYERVVEVWRATMDKLKAAVPKTLDPKSGPAMMITSKARGTIENFFSMSGMKGLVRNPSGRIIELPIISSYKEGLNVLEYFIATHGARKGTADTALRTAHAGYLTRRLVDVSQDLVITEADCKTKKGFSVTRKDSEEINRAMALRVFSRVLAEDVKDAKGKVVAKTGDYIDEDRAKAIDASGAASVVVRSPITCRAHRGICQKCYGYDLGKNVPVGLGEAVGIVAAQAIGEPGTQLTMRTFHVGGVVGAGDITLGLPRVDEVFEARPPHGKAVVSDVSGVVEDITEVGREKVVRIGVVPEEELGKKKSKKGPALQDVKEFRVPSNVSLLVNKGDSLKRGAILTEGHADLKELFKYAGTSTTQNYIIKEIQMIYSLQGAPIHDKHIEVIARQMFSRVRIKESGDTIFTTGEIVEKSRYREENRKVEKEGKNPAKAAQLLLGITKVALTTESFLSAASFQETTRVLINAAVEGKKDMLRGLKENVIIGRLIPAGTGYGRSKAHRVSLPNSVGREAVER